MSTTWSCAATKPVHQAVAHSRAAPSDSTSARSVSTAACFMKQQIARSGALKGVSTHRYLNGLGNASCSISEVI